MANYVSSYTGSQHDQYVMASQIVNLIYPVDNIYMSINSTIYNLIQRFKSRKDSLNLWRGGGLNG